MSVLAVTVVPTAPLLLSDVCPRPPEAAADGIAALRATIGEVLRGLPEAATLVLIADGEDATLPDGGCVDLSGYGHPEVRADIPVDRELLAAVATRTSTPRVRADVLTGDLAVLALLVAEHRPAATVVPMTVTSGAAAASLAGFAAGVTGAVAATGRQVAVVASGDLSAARETTSPGYLVEGARDWDDAVVAALRADDLEALAGLGPREAARVSARGWAPVLVASQVARAAQLRLTRVELSAPRGVGQLVASSA